MSPSSTEVTESKPVIVHRLPCVIEHDGPAEVSKYFKSNLEGIQLANFQLAIFIFRLEKKASFRGRHLVSSELVVPEPHSSTTS